MAIKEFPSSVKIKNVDRKSADWQVHSASWDKMFLMYEGGAAIEAAAEQFLTRRPKEPPDVFQSRCARFSYENHVGTAVDWYLAALFEKSPRAEAPEDAKIDEFYGEFEKNCDRAGTPFVEHLRTYYKNLLLFGRAATLVDLPPAGEYVNRQQEIDAGQDEPYLCAIDPRTIINSSFDEDGVLDWIIFYSRECRADDPFKDEAKFDVWYYFDKTTYAVYEREIPKDENTKPPDDAEAQLVKGPKPHALADKKQVPIVYTELPEGLWLMNRAFSPAKNHVNTANALDWALMMSALAMPVIKMDGEFSLTLTESGFIKLPRDSEYNWSEPEGKSHTLLADRAENLVEQVFRAFYLIAQARSTSATPAAQSGVSKQQDMAASQKILNLFGDVMRNAMEKLMTGVSDARGEEIKWDIRGLEFPEESPDVTLSMVGEALALDIPSDTFAREMQKTAASAALPDAPRELLDKIHEEINSAPTKAEREMQEKKDHVDMITKAGLKPKAPSFPV